MKKSADPAESYEAVKSMLPKGDKRAEVELLRKFRDRHLRAGEQARREVEWHARCSAWAHAMLLDGEASDGE